MAWQRCACYLSTPQAAYALSHGGCTLFFLFLVQERKQAVRAPKRRVGAKVAPAEMTAAEAAASAEIEENRTEMLTALVARGNAGAGMLEAVLNHKSFAQTVENVFALSFMARAPVPFMVFLALCPGLCSLFLACVFGFNAWHAYPEQ